MTKTNKGLFSLCIPLLTLFLLFAGCKENPGSVGNEYIENPELTFDTLSVSSIEFVSFSGYSGRLRFIPIGFYSDPVFGDLDATGLILPRSKPSFPDSLEIGDFTMSLEIQLDSTFTYGDTLAETSFTMYPITTDWRGTTHRIDTEVTYDESNPVGNFTIGAEEKRILVEDLSQTWVNEYNEASMDSTIDYGENFKGLAIVSDNDASRISFSRVAESRFLIINEAQTDTFTVNLDDWAYSLNRSGSSIPSNTYDLHTTLEGMTKVVLPIDDIKEYVEGKNLISAELLLFEAQDELNSSLPDNHNRLSINTLKMDKPQPNDPEYEYQFRTQDQVDYLGYKQESSNNYQFDMVSYVNNVAYGSEDEDTFFIGIGSSSGALRSTLIYNENAADSLLPKLIFTSLADE